MADNPFKPPANPFAPSGIVTLPGAQDSPDAPKGGGTGTVHVVKPSGSLADGIAAANAYAPRTLSPAEIAKICQTAGFKGPSLIVAVAVALAESSGQTNARGPELSEAYLAKPQNRWIGPGPQAMGLFQILPAYAQSGFGGVTGSAYDRTDDKSQTGARDFRQLDNPDFNARSAYALSKGGTNWQPWSTYNGGQYLQHMGEATDAVKAIGAATVVGADGTTVAGASSNGTPVVDVTWTEGTLLPVRLGGTGKAGDLGVSVVGGTIDQSVKQPSELTLEIHDPDLSLLTKGTLKRGVRLAVNAQHFTIVDIQIGDGGAGAHITVHALASGIVGLMHTDPPNVTKILPGKYVAILAKAVGSTLLSFSGPGWSVQDIAPAEVTASPTDEVLKVLNPYNPAPAPGSRAENAYEVIDRLSTAAGYELWEDARGLYWGPATSSTFSTALFVSWRGQPAKSPTGAVRALAVPKVVFSTPGNGRYARVSGSFTVAPGDYPKLILGQRVDMALGALLVARPDVTAEQAASSVSDVGLLRVTHINRNLGDLTSPVTVEFESATNIIGSDNPAAAAATATNVPAPGVRAASGVGSQDPLAALATALAAVGRACTPRSCMHTVATWFGLSSSGWDRAIDGWNGTPASLRHPGDKAAPPGALLYWSGGTAGHVALADGQGGCVSTDFPSVGRIGNPKIDEITEGWHKVYLGWTNSPYFPHGG